MVITLITSSFQVTTIAIICCLAFIDPNSSLSKLVISLVVKTNSIHWISICLILNLFHQFPMWLIGRSINSIGLPSKSIFVSTIYASLSSSPNISSFNSSSYKVGSMGNLMSTTSARPNFNSLLGSSHLDFIGIKGSLNLLYILPKTIVDQLICFPYSSMTTRRISFLLTYVPQLLLNLIVWINATFVLHISLSTLSTLILHHYMQGYHRNAHNCYVRLLNWAKLADFGLSQTQHVPHNIFNNEYWNSLHYQFYNFRVELNYRLQNFLQRMYRS